MMKINLAAALVLASTLTFFGCSSDSDNGDESGSVSSSSGGGSSSNIGGSSSSSSEKAIEYGTISYGGQDYKTVKIGGQTWMAENLNYEATGSKCYDNDLANCEIYGRLYDWATAMALPSSCNSSECAGQIQAKHQGICPIGWHIPTNAEWDALFRYVDGDNGTESPYDSETAGKHLKAASGWNYNRNGTDTYGFAALPGGFGLLDGYLDVGYDGIWWSASEYDDDIAYNRHMVFNGEGVYWDHYFSKAFLFSVRCLQD